MLMATDYERVLAGYEAWNRGDLDAWLEMMDPEVEMIPAGVFPGFDSEYRGHAGMERFWRQLHEPFEVFHIDVERLDEDEQADCVVATIRFRARGTGSGVDVDMTFAHALRLRDGRVTLLAAKQTADEARAALRERAG
jgi:ketosteroid isomerase-like protein